MEDATDYKTLKASQSLEQLNTSIVSLDAIEAATPAPKDSEVDLEIKSTTITVQPTTVIVEPRHSPSDHHLIYSVISSILCLICGTWLALFCTIPAIIFSIYAQNAEAQGNIKKMKEKPKLLSS